jgi:hypothetical protein
MNSPIDHMPITTLEGLIALARLRGSWCLPLLLDIKKKRDAQPKK